MAQNEPSPLAASRVVTVGSGDAAFDVTVFEMTPAQIRGWLVNLQSGDAQTDVIRDLGVVGGPTLSDLLIMSNADGDALEAVPESATAELKRIAKELNPGFFDRKAVVSAAMQAMVAEILKTQSTPSSKAR